MNRREGSDDENTGDLSDPVSDFYEQEFRDGNKLAPFVLARVLEIRGTPPDQVPGWLVNYFISLGARFLADLHDVSRTGRDPSLDRLAGLAGSKPRPWNKSADDNRALIVALFFDKIVKAAREGCGPDEGLVCDPAIPRGDPRRNDPSNSTHYADSECGPVRVLDNRGRPTKGFKIALGRRCKINAVSDDPMYTAVNRCFKMSREIRARHGDI